MLRQHAWLRAPRNLWLLFGVVIFVPAATLVTLGGRLMEQDRLLAAKRQTELVELAADQSVRALNQDFAALRKSLEGPPPSELLQGAAWVTFRAGRLEAVPFGRIPYFPRAMKMEEAPSEPFRDLESEEFREPPDLEKALTLSRALAKHSSTAIRAGALLREARILRAMGRREEALVAYTALSKISLVSIGGEPASLFAERARCAVLAESSRSRELRTESRSLAAGLRKGTWQLDRETYLYVAGHLREWLGEEFNSDVPGEDLAAGTAWLYDQWAGPAALERVSGATHALRWNGELVTIVWSVEPGRATGFIAGAEYLKAHWRPILQPASGLVRGFIAGVDATPRSGTPKTMRSSSDTGLPWSIAFAPAGGFDTSELEARRRNLLAALGAVLVLVAAAGYSLWGLVNRDLAVARLQSEFVSAVSHEFRTPLTALRQFNDLLAEEDGPSPEKRRSYYQAQSRATERLYRLVESLLDFARMEAGRRPYRLEAVDAGGLAAAVAGEFRGEAAAFGFTVTCHVDSPYPIVGDREALSRALWNLLDNAMKYSGPSREITVEADRAGQMVYLAVIDKGIGIPADEEKRIFDKFVRGSAAKAARVPGTGLGLAMVRYIVRAHGGTVDVKSAIGEGSVFTITLPLKEEK